MRKLAEKRPFTFALLICLLQIGLYGLIDPLLYHIKATLDYWTQVSRAIPQNWYAVGVTAFYVLIASLIITRLGWWRKIGILPSSGWRHLSAYIIPACLMCWLALPMLHPETLQQSLSYLFRGLFSVYFLFFLLLGIHEELFDCGIILTTLRKRGNAVAIAGTALMVGLVHACHFLSRDQTTQETILQMLHATAWGFGVAVLALYTRTIVPLMVIHALTDYFAAASGDFFFQLSASTQGSQWWFFQLPYWLQIIFFQVPYCLLALYGIYLLRKMPRQDHIPLAQEPAIPN